MSALKVTKAYLLGALHDGTSRKTTYRISQNNLEYINLLARGIKKLGKSAWIYREGKTRNLYVVEFSKPLVNGTKIVSRNEKIDYVRGYFDAEGGIAHSSKVRYYLYFCQRNLADLRQVREYLEELGIFCGVIHNPSRKVDPNYWRFFIKAKSYNRFADLIGSLHPIKKSCLQMKI